MGWFGLGGGNDQNDPLANVEVPKDQLPPEVQKPASAKDIQRSNVAANVGQFDELAHGLSRFSKVVTDFQREGCWKEAMEIFTMQEKSRHEEFEVAKLERQAEIERLKRGAMDENLRHQKEMKRIDHENNMKKAQYEDELRNAAKDRNLQKELQAKAKQEEMRRQTIVFEQEEALKHEEKKAMIHARAQAQVERENHDLRMERARVESKEKAKQEAKVAEIQSKNRFALFQRIFANENNMLGNMAWYGALSIGAVIVVAKVAQVGGRFVESRLAKPKLIQETSKMELSGLGRQLKKRFAKAGPVPKYIFNPQVREKVEDITLVTRNVQRSNTAHRNVLLYGPPGTGKTMYAKQLAKQSGMHYAIMSGGDVAPMGGEGVTELNKTFDWAQVKTKKGLVLFIDEADAFLRPREEAMSTDLRSAINTFLARTGEPNKNVQIVLATNQIRQLDSAVLDRMNELVEIPLPGHPERLQMLQQYLLQHVFQPASDAKQRVELGADLVHVVNDSEKYAQLAGELANMTEGMSGREIEKMCSNVYASAVSQEDPVITLEKLEKAAEDYKAQSDKKADIRAYREKAMDEGKSY